MQAKVFDIRARLSALVVIGAIAIPCVVMAQDVPDISPASDVQPPQVETDPAPVVSSSAQTGVATYYARSFHGRRTASGEAYDMNAMTAAHRTWPLGSYVRVTSLSTRRSVVVRVNDRGPFVRGRDIDVSFAAATMLGLQRSGSAPVMLERVSSFEVQDAPDAPDARAVNHVQKRKHVTKIKPVKHAKKHTKNVHRASH